MSYESSMSGFVHAEITRLRETPGKVIVDSRMLEMIPGCCYVPLVSRQKTSDRAGYYPSEEEIIGTLAGWARRPDADSITKSTSISNATVNNSSPFEHIRPRLIEDAYIESIAGHEFNDIKFRAFRSCSRTGKPCRPSPVHARSAIIKAASPRLREYFAKHGIIPRPPGQHVFLADYDGYEDDSDLSDCEEDDEPHSVSGSLGPTYPVEMLASRSSHKVSASRNLFEEAYVGSLIGARAHAGGVATPTPETIQSSSFQARLDAESFSDEDTDGYCTDFSEDLQSITSVSTDDQHTPSVSSEDSQTINGTSGEEYVVTVQPKSQCSGVIARMDIDQASSLPIKRKVGQAVSEVEGIMVSDGAYRTWKSLILYLYHGRVSFALLRTGGRQAAEEHTCSPKSMYRLATKFGLEKLKQEAKDAVRAGLSEKNIVEELFCDFTWRYPEILKMEVAVFNKLVSSSKVQADWDGVSAKIAAGQYPKSSVVLTSLFAQR